MIRLPFGLAIGRWTPPLTLAFWAVLHLADRAIAGAVQCSALGCLPR